MVAGWWLMVDGWWRVIMVQWWWLKMIDYGYTRASRLLLVGKCLLQVQWAGSQGPHTWVYIVRFAAAHPSLCHSTSGFQVGFIPHPQPSQIITTNPHIIPNHHSSLLNCCLEVERWAQLGTSPGASWERAAEVRAVQFDEDGDHPHLRRSAAQKLSDPGTCDTVMPLWRRAALGVRLVESLAMWDCGMVWF